MAKQKIVTLMTDFGEEGPYAASIKGVLLQGIPSAVIVDITHRVPTYDVLAGAFILAQAAPYFPADTVHLVVVDPGVGTDRNILVARCGRQTFICPDNGVLSMVVESARLEAIVSVRNPRFMPLPGEAMTFQGRDIFAPLATYLLNGLDIHVLGPEPEVYKVLDIPRARDDESGIFGRVVFVDHFGNLITDIPGEMVRNRQWDLERLNVRCGGIDVGKIRGTYGFTKPGQKLALFNSMSLLEVAVNMGRACDVLNLGVGAEVSVTFDDRPGFERG